MMIRFALFLALSVPLAVRASDPGATIDALAAKAAQLPADRRATLVRPLEDLGPAAFDALLARVQRDSAAMGTLAAKSPAAYRAFKAALVEALGELRDRRAADVLRSTFEGSANDPRLARAAAEGLGRLCRETAAIPLLASRLEALDPLEKPAISGLGLCRTERAAEVLVARLAAKPDEPTTIVLAEAMGQLGASWAWQSMGPFASGEWMRVRTLLSDALLAAWRTATPAARKALTKALLVVDDPATGAAVNSEPGLAGLRKIWRRAHGLR